MAYVFDLGLRPFTCGPSSTRIRPRKPGNLSAVVRCFQIQLLAIVSQGCALEACSNNY